MPKHYWDTLKDYYLWLHPPQEKSELEELSEGVPADIDFDKMSAAKRTLFGEHWGRSTHKGEPV